jgi:hypothetical protein
MLKKIFTFLLLLYVLMPTCYANEHIYKYLVIDNNSSSLVKLKVVSSKKDIEKGLMGVKYLNWNEGMFFNFKEKKLARIWMKGMQIPIDIIFLSKNYKINKLINKANPCNTANCHIYSAKQTKYVLELKAGMIDKYRINENSFIEIK